MIACLLAVAYATSDFIWLSDIHLDLIYNSNRGQHYFCRAPRRLNEPLSFDIIAKLVGNDAYLNILKRRLNVTTQNIISTNFNISGPEGIIPRPYREGFAGDYRSHLEYQSEFNPLLASYHGRYGCDSPISLVWSAFESIRAGLEHKSMMLITGDLVAHYWKPAEDHLRMPTLAVMSALIRQYFTEGRGDRIELNDWDGNTGSFLEKIVDVMQHQSAMTVRVPAIIALGNNDLERDYLVEENSQWNKDLFELWQEWMIPTSQKEVFVRGGFYRVDLHEEFNMTLLVLNTVWYHRLAVNVKGEFIHKMETDDPAGQLAWLDKTLAELARSKRNVVIVGHVPPSRSMFRNGFMGLTIDAEWVHKWAIKYEQLINPYLTIIKGQFFGHLHTDEFRVILPISRSHQKDAENITHSSADPNLILIAPSISPVHGNNPSWRRLQLNMKGEVVRYEQHYGRLYGYEKENGMVGNFGTFDRTKLFDIKQKYGSEKLLGNVPRLDGKLVLHELEFKIFRNAHSVQKWWQNQLIYGGAPPAFVLRCVLAQRFVRDDVQKCVLNAINAENAAPMSVGNELAISI